MNAFWNLCNFRSFRRETTLLDADKFRVFPSRWESLHPIHIYHLSIRSSVIIEFDVKIVIYLK